MPAKEFIDTPMAIASLANKQTLEAAANKLHASKLLARAAEVLKAISILEDAGQSGWCEVAKQGECV